MTQQQQLIRNHKVCICQICDTPLPKPYTLPENVFAICEKCTIAVRGEQP